MYFGVDTAAESERNPTTWFAGVRLGKRYVSYYLIPVYVEQGMAHRKAGAKQESEGRVVSREGFRTFDQLIESRG